MCPRPYQLGKRQGQIDAGRDRVLGAARSLLEDSTNFAGFTIDGVARRANVARATIYYQFDSKTGLLEALCDALADTGRMSQLAEVFSLPDPVEAIHAFIACFARFWDSNRVVMKRLRALAALDSEVAKVIAGRDERRRSGLQVLVSKLSERDALEVDRGWAVRTLFTLTSFETFDSLTPEGRAFSETSDDIFLLTRGFWKGPLKTP